MEFISFARAHGVEIGRLEQGDRIYRCATTNHPKSTNGAYYFDGDRGWVQSWESGEGVQWWNSDKVTPWSDADKREWAARRHAAEASKRQTQADAAKRAQDMLSGAKLDAHGYLIEKGFPEAVGFVIDDGRELLIPMRDCVTNQLLGLQSIRVSENQWQKKMIYGMRAKGAVLRLGSNRANESYLVEGYSTALSVDAAVKMLRLNASVVVCFSAQNLVHVAEKLSGNRRVFADNDHSQTGQKAAEATGLPWVMADAVGEDANDLHRRAGVVAVAQKLMEVRRQI